MLSTFDHLRQLFAGNIPVIYLRSAEEQRAERIIKAAQMQSFPGTELFAWTATRGVTSGGKKVPDSEEVLKAFDRLPESVKSLVADSPGVFSKRPRLLKTFVTMSVSLFSLRKLIEAPALFRSVPAVRIVPLLLMAETSQSMMAPPAKFSSVFPTVSEPRVNSRTDGFVPSPTVALLVTLVEFADSTSVL